MKPQPAFVSIASIIRRAAPLGLLLLALLMAGGALVLLAIRATEAQSAPSPPASVSVTHGDGTLTATWPAGAGATTYWVAYRPVGAGWQNAAINHPTTSITIPNVDNTLSYIVQVASRNAHSDSGWTQSPPSGPYAPWFRPPPPASVSATRGDGTITATWPAVSSATGYRVVYWSLGNSFTTFAANYSGTSVTITGVDNSNYYFVAVHSVNQYGESDSRVSPVIWPITSPTATPVTPPDMPASVRVTRGDGTMTVTWTASNRATGYGVLYIADDSPSWSTAASNLAATSYTIKGVDNAMGFSVAVHASNSGGHSSWNLVLQIMPYNPGNAPTTVPGTIPATVPAAGTTTAPPAPSSVTVNRADGTLTASWPAVRGARSYRVEHFTDDEYADHTRVTWGHTANRIVITGVDNATSYIVRVSARSAGGDSAWNYSPSVSPYNPPAKPTPRPTPITVASISARNAIVRHRNPRRHRHPHDVDCCLARRERRNLLPRHLPGRRQPRLVQRRSEPYRNRHHHHRRRQRRLLRRRRPRPQLRRRQRMARVAGHRPTRSDVHVNAGSRAGPNAYAHANPGAAIRA